LPNETLILGIGAGRKTPVWSDEVEAFIPATEAQLLLTFDHRVVDGAVGAAFLQSFKAHLEDPLCLLLS
jgi:pyruvate/2-oxoglutarate dehydrogenase complex dihydrolipoamide acyltransferase (E2) component